MKSFCIRAPQTSRSENTLCDMIQLNAGRGRSGSKTSGAMEHWKFQRHQPLISAQLTAGSTSISRWVQGSSKVQVGFEFMRISYLCLYLVYTITFPRRLLLAPASTGIHVARQNGHKTKSLYVSQKLEIRLSRWSQLHMRK